jgi:hypothetical protein
VSSDESAAPDSDGPGVELEIDDVAAGPPSRGDRDCVTRSVSEGEGLLANDDASEEEDAALMDRRRSRMLWHMSVLSRVS